MVSQNVIVCAPNYIDNSYLPVGIHASDAGEWATELPLTNLATDNFSYEVARSAGVDPLNAEFEIFLRELKDIQIFVLPQHNMRRQGTYRVRYSSTPKWAGAVVAAGASAGASSVTLQATTGSITLSSTDKLMFPGDPQVYSCGTSAVVADGATQVVSITPNLQKAVTINQEIECASGDYTGANATYDSGVNDAIPTIHPPLYPYWGHPSFWDGKPSDEQIERERFPIIIIHDELQFASFIKVELDDSASTNPDGFIELPRVFVSPGWQPPYNCSFGSSEGLRTDTSVRKTLNSRKVYNVKPTERTFNLIFEDLSEDEVYSNIFDVLRDHGIHKQVFVIFNPTDTTLLHRRAFTATIQELPAITYDYTGGPSDEVYTAVSLTFQFVEVVA